MRNKLKLVLFFLIVSGHFLRAQPSPFGNGTIMNQILGDLTNPSANFTSNTGLGYNVNFPNPLGFLSTNNVDLYVPSTYDGTESYGLVVYIDSDNDGNVKTEWIDVFEEDKLIWVAPDNIGNSVDINARMGIAWASLLRAKEIFNIDTSRIYLSGQSGGARMAQTLAYLYPEVITGSVPICGASYPIEVDQDYETQNPDSHYEIIYNLTQNDVNYIKSYDRRYAIMTSYDDFREGDIMNIYYNGFEKDNLNGKFLEIPGGHCSSSTQHFINAISFVEHPDMEVLKDTFTANFPQIGNQHYLKNANISNGSLTLNNSSISLDSISYLKTSNGFDWNNRYGAIIELDVNWSNGNRKPIQISSWEFKTDSSFCTNNGVITSNDRNIDLIIKDVNGSISCSVLASPAIGIIDTIYRGSFSNWNGMTPLNVKWQLWDDELRIEFDQNLITSSTISGNAKLLDDNRAIIIKWENLTNSGEYWDSTSWQNGSYLMISNNSIDNASVNIDNISIISANNNYLFQPAPPISITIQDSTLEANSGFSNYDWYLNNLLIQSGVSNVVLNPVLGDYKVVGTLYDVCKSTSSVYNFNSASLFAPESDNNFVLFPNPVSDFLNIQLKESNSIETCYRLFSLTGEELFSGILFENGKIDVSNINSGTYFIEIGEFKAMIVKE